jgi:hypothetical protein
MCLFSIIVVILTIFLVITEEDEEDIDDIDESDEDSDELSKMLDKANAKIKQEQMQQQQQDPLSLKLKEEPPQQAWSVVKTEAEIKKEPNLTPGPNWTVKTQQVRLFFSPLYFACVI